GRRHFSERARAHAIRRVLELGVIGVIDEDLPVPRQRGSEELPEVAVADDAEGLEAHVLASVSGAPSNALTEFRLETPAHSSCASRASSQAASGDVLSSPQPGGRAVVDAGGPSRAAP